MASTIRVILLAGIGCDGEIEVEIERLTVGEVVAKLHLQSHTRRHGASRSSSTSKWAEQSTGSGRTVQIMA